MIGRHGASDLTRGIVADGGLYAFGVSGKAFDLALLVFSLFLCLSCFRLSFPQLEYVTYDSGISPFRCCPWVLPLMHPQISAGVFCMARPYAADRP